MGFKKYTALLVCAVLICATASAGITYKEKEASVTVPAEERRVIILDAGHGGFDGGAVANDGTVEKDINLAIATVLADFLSSRKKSDMRNRLELIKKYPDSVFVSIHLNKFTTSAASGSQVFYGPKCEESKPLGEYIQSSIIRLLQPQNKRVNKQATSSTYLLYNAPVPAVLVECGFLSNTAELERLKDESYQKKMAFCIFCGIEDYFSE